MRLTNENVASLKYEGVQAASGGWPACYVWDGVPGFGVRLYPSGSKTYVLKYRNEFGRQRFYKLGRANEIAASDARRDAMHAQGHIRDGLDPNEEKSSRRDTFTVDELGQTYIERFAKVRKKRWDVDQDRLNRHINPRWGKMAAPEVTRAMVDQMHRDIKTGTNTFRMDGTPAKGGPNEANRALALVSKLYSWAIEEGCLPPGTANPARGIKKFKEKKRARWVQHYEMPWLLDALDEIKQPYIRTFFWLILQTGARKSEGLGLLWSDVDFTGGTLTFRDTKNRKDHAIPLTKGLAERLAALTRVEGNPHVFVGRKEGTHLKDVRDSWRTTKDRANELAETNVKINVSDVTIHDLRRTVGAWLATSGYSELLIGRVLNHTSNSVTGVYARLSDEAVRNALEDHSRRLRAVREPATNKVIELHGGVSN